MIIVAGVCLLFFGNRLPSVMRSLGKSVTEFKKGVSGIEDDIDQAVTADKKRPRPSPASDRERDRIVASGCSAAAAGEFADSSSDEWTIREPRAFPSDAPIPWSGVDEMFGSLGPMEMMLIMGLGVLLFGKRLPEVGRSLGRGIVEFKKGLNGVGDDFDSPSSGRSSSSSYGSRGTPTIARPASRPTRTPWCRSSSCPGPLGLARDARRPGGRFGRRCRRWSIRPRRPGIEPGGPATAMPSSRLRFSAPRPGGPGGRPGGRGPVRGGGGRPRSRSAGAGPGAGGGRPRRAPRTGHSRPRPGAARAGRTARR